MRPALRLILRLVITAFGIGLALLATRFVGRVLNYQFSIFAVVLLTYLLAAYFIFPAGVRLILRLRGRQAVPRYTLSSDGVPGDPINVALVGTEQQLRDAFSTAGWSTADRLSVGSSVHMATSFVLGRPYPTAPFSSLYMQGRKQDIGFQLPIGDSPRRRHHIRFWRLPLDADYSTNGGLKRLLEAERAHSDQADVYLWAGAGTKDTGFGLTKYTWQISHSVDDDANAERDFIMRQLTESGVVTHPQLFAPPPSTSFDINQYITDGRVSAAILYGNPSANSQAQKVR